MAIKESCGNLHDSNSCSRLPILRLTFFLKKDRYIPVRQYFFFCYFLPAWKCLIIFLQISLLGIVRGKPWKWYFLPYIDKAGLTSTTRQIKCSPLLRKCVYWTNLTKKKKSIEIYQKLELSWPVWVLLRIHDNFRYKIEVKNCSGR